MCQQSYLPYCSFFSIASTISPFRNKGTFYLRAGLFARLGVTLIGLIYKIQSTLIGVTSVVKGKLISIYTTLDKYAFAKAYQTFISFADIIIWFINHKTNTQKL